MAGKPDRKSAIERFNERSGTLITFFRNAKTLLVAAIAVGLPGLTGHAAGLGSHSVALVSGVLHIVATSLWAGGLFGGDEDE